MLMDIVWEIFRFLFGAFIIVGAISMIGTTIYGLSQFFAGRATDEDFDDRAMEVFGFLLILSSIGYVLWYLNRVIG